MPFCQITLVVHLPKLLASQKETKGYTSNPESLGEHLRKHRLDLGLLQSEASLATNTALKCYEQWERDECPPRPESWPKIIAFLGYDPRPVPLELGARLVWFRNKIGLGQRAMAKHLGVNVQPLRKWEHGKALPCASTLKVLHRMAEETGVPALFDVQA